ncbi:STAS domain-containing protein [Kitasatospora sp. NPDC059646]|uniref:STAS domain-containing protein n=1 Tax=Kitasatospora sp. NPDC059646 TaxID=3346893 RepID=UPI00367567FB
MREVVLDLSEVTFMDRAGPGALVRGRNQAGRSGGRLVLARGRPPRRPAARTHRLRRARPSGPDRTGRRRAGPRFGTEGEPR